MQKYLVKRLLDELGVAKHRVEDVEDDGSGGGRHGAETGEQSPETIGGGDIRDNICVPSHRAGENDQSQSIHIMIIGQ